MLLGKAHLTGLTQGGCAWRHVRSEETRAVRAGLHSFVSLGKALKPDARVAVRGGTYSWRKLRLCVPTCMGCVPWQDTSTRLLSTGCQFTGFTQEDGGDRRRVSVLYTEHGKDPEDLFDKS